MAILYDWVSVKRENVGLYGKLFTIYTNELKYQEKSLSKLVSPKFAFVHVSILLTQEIKKYWVYLYKQCLNF